VGRPGMRHPHNNTRIRYFCARPPACLPLPVASHSLPDYKVFPVLPHWVSGFCGCGIYDRTRIYGIHAALILVPTPYSGFGKQDQKTAILR